MRQIVLDTETTGLEPSKGHRMIEIGCVEIVNRRVTQTHYHQYLQPERDIDAGAMAVHGITNEFLQDKPTFEAVVKDFLLFVRGAELIIHNAPFDVGFMNHELKLLGGFEPIETMCDITDTLVMARNKFPGQRNNLDALCKRLGVSNAHRELHGALLDAEILAEVYLAMTGGQVSLSFEEEGVSESHLDAKIVRIPEPRAPLLVLRANPHEQVAHEAQLDRIEKDCGGPSVWRQSIL